MSEQLSGSGAVAALERRLERYYGIRHALAMPSATTGLLAAALALDIRGSEFITTPYSWGGTVGPWLLAGARPRFADIDSFTLELAAASARRLMTRRTRALLAVDVYGVPSDQHLRRGHFIFPAIRPAACHSHCAPLVSVVVELRHGDRLADCEPFAG